MRFFGNGPGWNDAHGPQFDADAAGQDRRHARGFFGREDGGGFRQRGGGGGGLGRLFAHGDLRHVALYLIAEKPRHGYEIIKAVEEMTAGAYTPSPGTVYPTLTLLEEQGLVTVAETDGGKKLYTITPEGTALLDLHRRAVEVLLERVKGAAARHGGPSPRIVRAIEGLRMALHLKSTDGTLSDEQIDQIVEALDEATRKIERA